jgi:sulfatase maturation enzyme AslB (radical SAM superfamily)
MQTNGALLERQPHIRDEQGNSIRRSGQTWAEILADLPILVTVSLDGPERIHDRHRFKRRLSDASVNGSYREARQGIEALKAAGAAFAGVLAVAYPSVNMEGVTDLVEFASEPFLVVKELIDTGAESGDIMYPHGTHDKPPVGVDKYGYNTPVGDFMIKAFNNWWRQEMRSDGTILDLRLFSSIISRLQGGPSFTESLGLLNGQEMAIRTDGSVEGVDAYRLAGRQHIVTDLNVFRNSINEVSSVLQARNLIGRKMLSRACNNCPFDIKDICGGNHISTRYSERNGLDNASIYCQDTAELVDHISKVLRRAQYLAFARAYTNQSLRQAAGSRGEPPDNTIEPVSIHNVPRCRGCTGGSDCCYFNRLPGFAELLASDNGRQTVPAESSRPFLRLVESAVDLSPVERQARPKLRLVRPLAPEQPSIVTDAKYRELAARFTTRGWMTF